MERPVVPEVEIAQLWDFFFDNRKAVSIQNELKGIIVAVAGTQERRDPFRREDDRKKPYREAAKSLLDMGKLFIGSTQTFSKIFLEDILDLSFETAESNRLAVIPFKTKSGEEGNDAVVVIYGKGIDAITYYFKRLSQEGWKAIELDLHRAFGV